jgi:sRNA-binding regulator protein Hfq
MDLESLQKDRTRVRIHLTDGTEMVGVIQSSEPDDNDMILVEDEKVGPTLISSTHVIKMSIYIPVPTT